MQNDELHSLLHRNSADIDRAKAMSSWSKTRVILAGLLELPAILLMAGSSLLTMILCIPGLCLLVFEKSLFSSKQSLLRTKQSTGKQHAIITGGSSGIGLAVAQECVRQGMNVTLLARNMEKLETAQKQLQKEASGRVAVRVFSVDVSDRSALQKIAPLVLNEEKEGTADSLADSTTHLFCCAGLAVPLELTNLSLDQIHVMNATNLLGTIYTVRAFLSFIKRGTVVLTSSAGGQVGVYGYTAYSATKFGLRGFAESLHMELVGRPIHVQVAYPPDTDTPGYQTENKLKPKACARVSEAAGLFTPSQYVLATLSTSTTTLCVSPVLCFVFQHSTVLLFSFFNSRVGTRMVSEATKANPPFAVWFGLDGWMLATLTAGMSPVSSLMGAVCQVSLAGLLRLVSLFYLNDFWNIVAEEEEEQEKAKVEATK